ncbi:hypothetical protein cym2001_01640 [Pseudomonas sp. CYM-20-01]|nr:hypothetical protein cym2001_01640 [Pseudomonas sp. CYM-20-01]
MLAKNVNANAGISIREAGGLEGMIQPFGTVPQNECGRGLAPDCCVSATHVLSGTPSSGASPLPQVDRYLALER